MSLASMQWLPEGAIDYGDHLWCPESFVLWLLLWKIVWDAVFKLPLPTGTWNVGYADDTLVVADGATVEKMQGPVNYALRIVADPIYGLGLRLAIDKT